MSDPVPVRQVTSVEEAKAVKTISRALWKQTYRAGRGPFHFATGPYWPNELRRQAVEWERWASAARIVSDAMERTNR